ncbi:MAG: glycosyltransferase family 4 protein, partial [Gammaproteobacteria bacterium]|nr:glycosyltransferase family 4 protein [Gammaproteobacteria bacterium]
MTPETKVHNILFIGHLWPEPTSSAAGYRTLALLKALLRMLENPDFKKTNGAHWQLHFTSAAEKTEFCAEMDHWGILSHQIKLNDSSFDHFVKNLNPEIVFYDRFITEEQFAPRIHEQCPGAINILDTQDLHFLRRARQNELKNSVQNSNSDLSIPQAINLQTDDSIREIAAILRCDLSLIISSYEMTLLTQQFKIDSELLHYCPFMLTLNQENNLSPSFEEREHFVMIGNFLHPPNWDAVLWCYQSIWPKIRKQLPQAEIHIYGAYPSEKVWQLHQPSKGFIIKGRADDALKTLEQYRVNLAPLRFGAGIKGKIADGFI